MHEPLGSDKDILTGVLKNWRDFVEVSYRAFWSYLGRVSAISYWRTL